MENKSKAVDFSFVKAFEYLLNFYATLLLIYGILLFDSLEIIVCGKGIVETDFSSILNLSAIPFFLLFLAAFGIIAGSLSSLANVAVFKLCVLLPFNFKPKPKIVENLINIGSLHEIALTTENAFLLEYIEKEMKRIHNARRNYRIIYSLSIAAIINWLVMLLYDKKTIVYFTICLYKSNGSFFIKICLTLLLIPVVFTILIGLKHSIIFYDDTIYFPEAKYRLLVEEIKSPLSKK